MTYVVPDGDMAARRKGARAVFRRLATGEEQARSELFEGADGLADWWQGLFMKRLETIGVTEKIGGKSGRYVKWRLAQTDAAATFIQALSTDEELLGTFLNGIGGHKAGGGESAEAEGGPSEVANGVGGGDDDVRLDFVLKLLAAVLENVVYLREETKVLGEKVDRLEEAFK